MKTAKNILILMMAVVFSMSGIAFGNDAAQSTLATAPGTTQPRVLGDVAGAAIEGIGEGDALAAVLRGDLPKTLDTSLVDGKTLEKVLSAIDYALEKLGKYSFPDLSERAKISAKELDQMRTETIFRLKNLRADLNGSESALKFFNVIHKWDHDFVYGYNRSAWDKKSSVSLGIEYVAFLSIPALAEVLAHEFCPKEHLIPREMALDVDVARGVHKDVYTLFQAPVFWAGGNNIVKSETNKFSALMSEKLIKPAYQYEVMKERINGKNLIRLARLIDPKDRKKMTAPQVVEAIIAPGAGFAMISVKVLFPGRDEPVEMMAAKPINELVDGKVADYDPANPPPQNPYGNAAFTQDLGGSWVFPNVNRYTGVVVDGKIEITYPNGTTALFQANNPEDAPLSGQCHLHGVGHWIKNWVTAVYSWASGQETEYQGVMVQGDVKMEGSTPAGYNAKWPLPSDTRAHTFVSLGDTNDVHLSLSQTNLGKEPIWVTATRHEYFRNLSPDVWMWLPATHVCPIHTDAAGKPDYTKCLPTGEIVPVSRPGYEAFDYNTPRKIGTFLDDSWTRIKKNPDGSFIVEIFYPAFNCKMRLRVHDKIVRKYGKVERGGLKSAQVFTHPNGRSVSVEPTNQLNNPLDRTGTTVWRDEDGKPLDTGMAKLGTGDTYEYTYEYTWLPLGKDELPKEYSAVREAAANGLTIADEEEARAALDANRSVQKADISPIAEMTEDVSQASSQIAAPVLASTKQINVAVVLQKPLIDKAVSGNAELEARYQVMLQDLRRIYGDAVVMVDSSDSSVLAAEINKQMERGYSVVGITDSVMVEKLSGKVRGAADRFKVMGVDLARPDELKDGIQFVNINYIVLMGLAAMRDNKDMFERAYRIVTGKNPASGIMDMWFIRVLPKIVSFSAEMDGTARTAALRKLFDAAA